MFINFREKEGKEKETSMWQKNVDQLPPVHAPGIKRAPTNWATWLGYCEPILNMPTETDLFFAFHVFVI